MFKVLFNEIQQGRLTRLSYIGYSIFLEVLLLLFVVALIFATGIAEHILGGNLQQIQQQLSNSFSLPFAIISIIVLGVIAFSSLNLTAKRLRDIGLSGWGFTLLLVISSILISSFTAGSFATGFSILVSACLALIPSDRFKS